MLKAVLAAAAAVTIAGMSLAHAQQRDGRGDGPRRFQPTIDDMRAFQAARLAALRAGLVLNGDQERNWPAFEQAMREIQKQRLDRFTKMRDARREGKGPPMLDPAERMRQRATRLSESGAVLKRLADATDPLYRSLDDAQKRRFAILSRSGGPRGAWQGWSGRGGRDGEPRGQRRTEAAPIDAAPKVEPVTLVTEAMRASVAVASEHRASRRAVAAVPVAIAKKTIYAAPVVLAGKTISATPVALDGNLVGIKSVSFGKKAVGHRIVIGAPPTFGGKDF